jgi:hypothetical protein
LRGCLEVELGAGRDLGLGEATVMGKTYSGFWGCKTTVSVSFGNGEEIVR